MTLPARGAIVIGAHINGLGVTRALARRGVPTIAISTRGFDIAQHSRWVVERHRLHELHDRPDALVDLLDRHASRWRSWVIFPTNDDALMALARHHNHLSRTYTLTCQPLDVVSRVVNKDAMYALATRVGLTLPRCYGEATAETAARGDLRFPVIVKPIRHGPLISRFGAKLFVARDRAELDRSIARLSEAGISGLLFDYVPGPDSEIYAYCVYVGADGTPSAGLTVRKVRQNPPFVGGARVAQTAPEIPALREATIELLRAAGYRGMAFAEFKRDIVTGEFVFIEVNGRAVLYNSLLPPTGIDLVSAAWEETTTGARPALARRRWEGTWAHLSVDLVASIRHRRQEHLSLADYLAPYRRRTVFAVWSVTDPLPFLAESALAARRLVS